MRMGRRADRLKADDPFLPALLPSALADFRPCWGGNGYHPNLPTKTRQARRPQACRPHAHTRQQLTRIHIAGNCQTIVVQCSAAQCCAVL